MRTRWRFSRSCAHERRLVEEPDTRRRLSNGAARARRKRRMCAAVLQREMPLTPDQLHAQFIELQAHASAAVDQLRQEFDHVRFGQVSASERAEFLAYTIDGDFAQSDPQVFRELINTTWCNRSTANHLQIGWLFECTSVRRVAADVVGQAGKLRRRARPCLAAISSKVKMVARESLDFGNNGPSGGECPEWGRVAPNLQRRSRRRHGRLHAKP